MLVVILSLSIYNYSAIPMFSLLEEDATNVVIKGHQIIYDMIQDRRLIATLVAAQASIFCPLFLLMSSCSTSTICHEYVTRRSFIVLSTSEIWRAIIEQFCQFLMPLGLGMSWIFCITFDQRTEAALIDQNMMGLNFAEDQALAAYVANGLKYIVIVVLLMEVLTIWLSSYIYAVILFKAQCQQHGIRLIEGDENDVEEYAGILGQEQEKILLI
ncbi:hypothetical protein [Parasitella parasitica]|uniref:Uncharacterized protein n=1 Tax=Parasitella parasitica TaxID=35722 RepID=A0A0B7NDP3_9FUNG|nr:hypothetical protein [Parasitella parasitica]